MKKILSTAPGRVCLFGDHQDYLELPVIACAIDRMMQIDAEENGKDHFEIDMPDMGQQRTILLEPDFTKIERGDFLKIALKVLQKRQIVPNKGYRLTITSKIPINAGLSSSSALTIAWLQFLIAAFSDRSFSSKELALLAYETEVIEEGSSGGKMDQFTIAIGDTIFLDTHTDRVQKFNHLHLNLVVGVSGLSKDTFGTLSHLKSNAWKAINQVKSQNPEFDIASATVNDLSKNLELVDTSLKSYFYAAVCNHDITQKALKTLLQEPLNIQVLGELMNEHHHLLKTYLKITPPLMDQMIDAANNNGALGSKIVGSGGGGCIVAIVQDHNQKQIIEAIKATGAADAFGVNITKGASLN
ncbi:MAG: galactokinase [Flavobacteriaceae bacterium]|nr:galactokinase [Flavobacteriaceae bacterium]